MNLSSKTVVITGAGSGIGRALALGFAEDGANVVGFGRTRANLKETVQLCRSGHLSYVVGDVASEEDVARLFEEAIARHGQVDILINNAAIYPKVSFLDLPHREWARVIETNVVGVALCCRRALPEMLRRGFGRIINVGSFAGKHPIPDSSAYSTSKAALRSLTKALASEIDREKFPNVLVNEFVPIPVKTSMSSNGADPMAVYPHAKFVVGLPADGPTGRIFKGSVLHIEDYGLRARLRRALIKLTGRTERY